MNIADAVKQNINEFGRMLNSGMFDKNDIEEFLKNNSECPEEYIKAITEYVNLKYSSKTSIYLEIAKSYFNKNSDEFIKYMEMYRANGGKNQNALIVLMRLYIDKGNSIKAMEIAKNINLNDVPQTEIKELFVVFMLLLENIARVKQQLENIIKQIDNYNYEDKKGFLNRILKELLEKIKSKNCKNLVFTVLKSLNALILTNKNLQLKEFLDYYLNLYSKMGDKEFVKRASIIANSNNSDTCILLNNILKLNVTEEEIYKTDQEKTEKILKIFNKIRDILTDENKWQVIELVLSRYRDNFLKTVEILCEFINGDKYFDVKLSEKLALVLREKKISADEKKDVIKLLKKNYRINSSVKYKNIFLNEIEILQNKIILQSKPRELDITVTTRCNLRCIMCDVYDLPDYDIGDEIYRYVKKVMPYLENIVWKGGEVFLHDKFYELISIAGQYNVIQTIITNGLFLTDDSVKLISQYKIELVISIDATDKKTYEKIREGANFDVLINNLKILQKYYSQNNLFKYKMAVVVMSINCNQIEQLINFAISHKFECICFQACTNCKNQYLLLNDLNKKEVIAQIEKYKNQYQNRISILTDATLSMNYFEKLVKNDAVQIQGATESQNYDMYKDKIQSENKFFKRQTNNMCGVNQIYNGKYKYDEIWNSPEITECRKNNADVIQILLCC
ncbi:hypothetical protein MASR1M68_07170 [Elusimicrobiota bacterium]